jgi:hypothetical protein
MDSGSSSATRPTPLPTATDISPSIGTRTSSKNAVNRTFVDEPGAEPTTPTRKSRRSKKTKGKEPVVAHGTRKEQLRRQHSDSLRHSHGLSWSSTTRDSVVDNLLLSLDNLSASDVTGVGDDMRELELEREKFRVPDMPSLPNLGAGRPAQRARGHTYSSSLSSGYGSGGIGESPSVKYVASMHGRRSISSSNFGTVRSQTARKGNGPTRVSTDTQRNIGTVGHVKSVSGDVDGVDHGYGASIERKGNFPSRRSMSMDQIYQESHAEGPSMLARGRPVPSVHSKYESPYDAAPEPGIPAGPRKKLNPTANGPVYVAQAPSKQSLRKVNTQSDLRTTVIPGPPIPQYIQDQASDFVRNNSMRGIPSMPLPHEHGAPAPSPGLKASVKDVPPLARERPGFFKRVFGGSRTASGLSSDSHETLTYGDNVGPPIRTRSTASHDTAQTRPETRKASKEHSNVPHPPPALNKKTSSFFRRRKKSNNENVMPPPLPTNGPVYNIKAAEPSPSVSSLRKVMDPYLAREPTPVSSTSRSWHDELTRPTTQESNTEDSDLDIFHSGYTPPPDASLGWRDPLRRDASSRAKQSYEQQDSPRLKIKVKKRVPDAAAASSQQSQDLGQQSFLHDASREVSTASLGYRSTAPIDFPKVSPMTETPLTFADDEPQRRPVSRASTGDRIIASQPTSPIDGEEMRNFSGATNVSVDPDDDSWVVMHSPTGTAFERPGSKKSERLFLRPNAYEEKRQDSNGSITGLEDSRNASRTTSLQSPALYTAASSILQSPGIPSVYHSATSLPLPSVLVDGVPRPSGETQHTRGQSAVADEGAEYRERARRIYNGVEDDITKGEAASWLGERNTLSTKTLQAYLHLFDLAGMNLLSALRALCSKLLLKGETQQVDRVINALSARWCECNPNHGFKAQDVVHTIFYSLILLNTDLHLADIGEKMSRSAYVKNTLPTIKRVVADAAPNAFDDTVKASSNATRPPLPWIDSTASAPAPSSPSSPSLPPAPETPAERTSLDFPRPAANKRLSIRPGMFRVESDGWTPDSAGGNASNALVSQPWTGTLRGWEFEVETVLKSFFGSIRTEPLPLLGTAPRDSPAAERNLSVAGAGGLKRSGSVVSKAPSDNASFRSKPGFRTMTMGWRGQATRSRPKLYPASTVGSSRTSFDDGNSVWSPAQSSMWSKNSFAKTLTSASMQSLGYHFSPSAADYKHSIGFANALSQAIIREEGGSAGGDGESISIPGGLLEDEALALEGAPWAKEGLVKHKHHLEHMDRKAKERSWTDCFAVISKGKLTIFNFNTQSKSHSMGRKSHAKPNTGRAASLAAMKVGGGDWMENAEQLDSFILRHTIASCLPSPGYSKARPHVWALSLPSGAVHLFQVGTPDIAQEFMTSANYWSARLSKEPLSGSVSNIEYGWSDQVINPALLDRAESVTTSPPGSMANNPAARGHLHTSSSASGGLSRPSFQSSLRGSLDKGFGTNQRSRLPGDKAQIADWQPPTQSMMASQLLEVDQLKQLTSYVSNVENELEKHNELKHAIELAVRHPISCCK